MSKDDTTQISRPQNIHAKTPSISLDRLTSLFALGLSVIALLVSILEVQTVKSQQRTAVWPHLQISEAYSGDGFRLTITNKGVGPALVGQVGLLIDSAPVDDLDTLILQTLGPDDAFSYERYRSSNPSSGVIAANETVTLFAVDWDEASRRLIAEWTNRVDVSACYCSIYEDCWTTSLTTGATNATSKCEKPERVRNTAAVTLAATVTNIRPTTSINDFKALANTEWEGALRYTNYGDGAEVSIPIRVAFKQIETDSLAYDLVYPDEPDYNSLESLTVSDNGHLLNGHRLTDRKAREDGTIILSTEYSDKDDNRDADITLTYTISPTGFSIAKNVCFRDTGECLLRNTYALGDAA